MDFIDYPVIIYTKARMGLVIRAYKKIIYKMDQEDCCWPIARLNDYLNYYPNEYIGKYSHSGVEILVYDEYEADCFEQQGILNPEENFIPDREFVHQKYLIDIVDLFTYVCDKITYTANLTREAFVKIWKAGELANQCDVAMEKWDPIQSHYMKRTTLPSFTKAKMVLVIQGYDAALDLMDKKDDNMWRRDEVNGCLSDSVKLSLDGKNYKIYYDSLFSVMELFRFVCDKISYADKMPYDVYRKICKLTFDHVMVPILEIGPMSNDL